MNYLSIFSPCKPSKLKPYLQTIALAAGLLCSAASSANLLNGDFSSGFDSWQGQVTYDDPTSGLPVDEIVSPLTSNFDATSGAAVITNDNINWGVALFQDFTVQSLLAPANTLWLELDFSSSVSAPFSDFVVAELVDLGGSLATLDISGGSVDITSWAGLNAEILFLVEDGDFGTGDFLTIDNIRITQHAASVPEPGSLALFLSAGLALLARRRLFKS
jgi:hypothetical protein